MSHPSGSRQSAPDPYEQWLGIPREEQPPSCYRVLGLRTFEDDPVLIAEAAAARRLLVEPHLEGPGSNHARRLLAEIAAAERCLLDPHRRARYDAELRGASPHPAGRPTETAPATAEQPATEQGLDQTGAGYSWRWRAMAPVALLVTAAVLLAAAASYRLILHRRTADSRETLQVESDRQSISGIERAVSGLSAGLSDGQPAPALSPVGLAAPDVSAGEAPVAMPSASTGQPSEGSLPDSAHRASQQAEMGGTDAVNAGESSAGSTLAAQAGSAAESAGAAGDWQPAPAAAGSVASPSGQTTTAEQGGLATGQTTAPPLAAETTTAQPGGGAQTAAASWSVPSQAEVDAAEKTIQSVMQNEFAAATDAAKRLALADRLVELASETDDDPAACYALCQMACTIAVQAGDFGRALAAIDALEDRFQIDVYAIKGDLLDKLFKATRNAAPLSAANIDLIEIALLLAYQAAIEAQAAHVERLLDLAKLAARRTKSDAISREVSAYEKFVHGLLNEATAVQTAERRLAADASDRAACQRVGSWYCFVCDRWEEGLPLLARGSDAVLASLAVDDAASPTATDARSELAERWWQQAERLDQFCQPGAYLRAGYWFELAAASLSREQLAVWQPRLLKFTHAKIAAKPFQYGAVAAGNVASSSRGATVAGSSPGAGLIDGVIPAVVGPAGMVQAPWPCEWTVVLAQTYRLREIRLKLPDADKSFQHYVLSTSADGVTFVPLADHSKIPSGGWQRFVFLSRPVAAIRVRGLFHSGNATFYATELEAYCAPPLTPPGERNTQDPQAAPPVRMRPRPGRAVGPVPPSQPPVPPADRARGMP